jgi:hypothetical protein
LANGTCLNYRDNKFATLSKWMEDGTKGLFMRDLMIRTNILMA